MKFLRWLFRVRRPLLPAPHHTTVRSVAGQFYSICREGEKWMTQ